MSTSKQLLSVHIPTYRKDSARIKYVIALIANHRNLVIKYTTEDKAVLCYEEENASLNQVEDYTAAQVLDAIGMDESNVEVLTLGIFYLVNCIQECNIDTANLDQYGRYKYSNSLQSKYDCVTDNMVNKLMETILNKVSIKMERIKSKIFISHDIDFLYNSKKEDVKWAAKNYRVGDLIKLIFQEIARKPHARNIDRVIKLDSEYDIRSTFFWLVNQGEGLNGIPNADYNIREEQDLIKIVNQSSCFNGLHKSASQDSIGTEINKSGHQWRYNRNHYLRFSTHDHWRAISESNIKLDCSLGFSEHYGFRNSYGSPFTPFDLRNNRPYNFVEAPLHVMDATFLYYLKTDPKKIGSTVIDFIEKNKQDCVLSILWHNNYLTDFAYKPFLKAYKEILSYIYEYQFESITPDEIIEQNTIQWDD